jgi:hypothetical protein
MMSGMDIDPENRKRRISPTQCQASPISRRFGDRAGECVQSEQKKRPKTVPSDIVVRTLQGIRVKIDIRQQSIIVIELKKLLSQVRSRCYASPTALLW